MEIIETSFWDQIDIDGTHLGMVGMLERSEGDLGGTPSRMTTSRSFINELIGPVWPFRYDHTVSEASFKLTMYFFPQNLLHVQINTNKNQRRIYPTVYSRILGSYWGHVSDLYCFSGTCFDD